MIVDEISDAHASRSAPVLLNPVSRLIRLAAPVTVGRLGVVGMGLVDMIVVGHLAPNQLAQLGLGWTINGPAQIGGIGLLVGVQIMTARCIGAGETKETGSIWLGGLSLAFLAGLLVCALVWSAAAPIYVAFGMAPGLALPAAHIASILALAVPFHLTFVASTNFLEAWQRPVPGAAIMWGANAVNLALNLVFVPRWGAVGSAVATVSSRLVLAGAIGAYILTGDLRACISGASKTFGSRLPQLLKIGLPASLSSAVEAGGFATLSVIAARIGAGTVAVFGLATGGLVTLAYMIPLGLATAGAVLSAQALGRGDTREAQRAGILAIGLTLAAMASCGIGCYFEASLVARFFTSDDRLIALFVSVMGLVALLLISDGGQGVADAILRARGINWFPTIARVIAFVGIAPALAMWLGEVHKAGLVGVMVALTVASFAAYGAMLARLAFMYVWHEAQQH